MNKRINKKIIISAGIILILVGVAGIYYNFFRGTPVEREQKRTRVEVSDVLEKVGELTTLPSETPVVTKITDISQAPLQQPFFRGAQNGDYLLIFKQGQKAILYGAKENKIINMGPIYFSGASSTIPGTSAQSTQK